MEKQNEYFADGVQDEILTDLAKIADLKVISRTSGMLLSAIPTSSGSGGAKRKTCRRQSLPARALRLPPFEKIVASLAPKDAAPPAK